MSITGSGTVFGYAADEPPHPITPAVATGWPATLLWLIGCIFVASAVIGPITAARRRQE